MKLEGTTAIITGGSGVLGGRICRALARKGVNLAIGYCGNETRAKEIAEELKRSGVETQAIACDVTKPEQVTEAVSAAIDRFGKIDILVNDGAYNISIPFDDLDALTFEEWSKILSINLTGPLLMSKAVASIMKSQGNGRIINISSVAGIAPHGSSIAYAVSKAGLNHLTRCLAVALAPEILVNCVAPGYLEGTLMSSKLAPEQIHQSVHSSLLGRAANKDDVASQVVEFCRTDSITGQTLAIDSGRTFH